MKLINECNKVFVNISEKIEFFCIIWLFAWFQTWTQGRTMITLNMNWTDLFKEDTIVTRENVRKVEQ